MKKTCIFQDTDSLKRTADLLEAAQQMHGKGRFESHAVVLDQRFDSLSGFFNRIVSVPPELVPRYDPRGICDILEALHRKNRFDSILIPATGLGKMIAPRLAKRLKTGIVPGVTEVRQKGGRIELVRPACSGKILEHLSPLGNGPVLASIRPNTFECHSGGGLKTKISAYAGPVPPRNSLRCLGIEPDCRPHDIRDSEVLISGGNGVRDNFHALYPLARALNGSVSASRKLVDQGVATRHIQVGQSGKTVSPRLYMALGIHGAMQHIAGLRQVESVISINTSKTAPICSLSDIVVEGDAREFIDRLMEKISTHGSETKEKQDEPD